jgi:C4-dicarboxylate-specific signal transduction histidine kinase
MPCAVNETAAVSATASSQRHHPDAAPDTIAEEPEWAWSAAEQLASDSEPRGHETQTELTSANPVAFLGQLSASIAEINQPISAVVMNAEAALRLLLAQPTDRDAIRRLLACIIKDGMRTGDIANRTRTMTDRKRADERLRASEQRLLDIQMELGHVMRMMALGEMTASIAHEVSQPLAAVVANAEASLSWLRCGTPDVDAACRSVEWIIDDGNRASEVIRRVRTLAKKTSLEKVPLDVNDVVREAILLMRRELISHQVSLRMNMAAGLSMILGDRIQLQQVIINLVMNGIEAMQSVTDRPRELVVKSGQDELGQVLISVADCGVGIAAENVDMLFDPFFTTKSSGLGMGLSICRSIVETHGGRLWATPTVPHGSLFQFTLPAGTDSAS